VRGDAAAAWAGSRWIEVGGGRMRYREAGRGPTLVLVHGLGVSADYWFRNGPELAEAGFRVLAPDLPGFGRSAAGGEPAESPVRQAEALIRWAQALALGPAVYVGHSLSCRTVLETAAREPPLVAGMVLTAPTSGRRLGGRVREVAAFLTDIPREPLTLATTVGLAYLRAGPLRVLRTWWRGTAHNPRAVLERVRAPALVIAATGDPVVEPEWASALAALLPDARLVWIGGGSHAVHASRPREFNHEIARFARRAMGAPPEAMEG
jgi:2-hydroxy-6-oxonona-2,4-dienedioate hydrolase